MYFNNLKKNKHHEKYIKLINIVIYSKLYGI